jgi:hypothetical protein
MILLASLRSDKWTAWPEHMDGFIGLGKQGAFAQIPLWWQDKQRRLVIEGRRGMYPGMREHQEFIVKIVPGNTQQPTREPEGAPLKIAYEGKRTVLELSFEKRLPNSRKSCWADVA